MSICSICGKEIDRGKKYQNERYKNIIVCSKECYEQLIEIKKNAVKKEPYPDYNVLLDYIKDQWLGSENVNWLLTVKFIKFLVEKKNMSCKDIYNVIKYAVEIEGYTSRPHFGQRFMMSSFCSIGVPQAEQKRLFRSQCRISCAFPAA